MSSINITKNNYKDLYSLLQKYEDEFYFIDKKYAENIFNLDRVIIYGIVTLLFPIFMVDGIIPWSMLPLLFFGGPICADALIVRGMYKYNLKKLEKKFGYTVQEMEKLKEQFESLGIIKYDGSKKVFCGEQYELYCTKSEEIKKSINNCYESYSYDMYIPEEQLERATEKYKVKVYVKK